VPIRYSYVTGPVALDYYQTVYAGRPGSAEMPSAGRPFSWELLRHLRNSGVQVADLVLHTGLSSYQDDDFDAEHHLFEEWFEVPATTAAAVKRARRTIAVGTSVVRALETVAAERAQGGLSNGRVEAGSGWTTLEIASGSQLRAVDGLITGLHEPQTTHFELLRAFVDEELLAQAVAVAIAQRYLFHEFGDSMLIL